ncbi:unnamed protein product [Rhizophagus irregularis]|nr:unnamed protein product [Rhizophagus irregularis]CAB5389713.1 unnamed protein product [Rhizophagus irregularis]
MKKNEQSAAATHQSTSVQNLTFDLGQLNLSGGSSDANTSFSNLVLDILKTTKENSEIIKETAKRNYEQIGLLIQIEQARNRGPVLGEYEIESSGSL